MFTSHGECSGRSVSNAEHVRGRSSSGGGACRGRSLSRGGACLGAERVGGGACPGAEHVPGRSVSREVCFPTAASAAPVRLRTTKEAAGAEGRCSADETSSSMASTALVRSAAPAPRLRFSSDPITSVPGPRPRHPGLCTPRRRPGKWRHGRARFSQRLWSRGSLGAEREQGQTQEKVTAARIQSPGRRGPGMGGGRGVDEADPQPHTQPEAVWGGDMKGQRTRSGLGTSSHPLVLSLAVPTADDHLSLWK